MSKVMFKYEDGLEVTKEEVIDSILSGFARTFRQHRTMHTKNEIYP